MSSRDVGRPLATFLHGLAIVAVHEVGLHEGHHYFSMDFVDGKSLAELARQQPLPARKAAEYIRDAAEAVHYAHQQGTLLRDLKPSNILIDRQGRVRITDFGLAKKIQGNSELTLTGQILGTPSYMPPEQASGKRSLISAPSDIYSLGAVLYELLTGRPPFRGETPVETLRHVETLDPLSPRHLNPATPRDLETICLKCLAKEPHKRYGTSQLLADDLGRFLQGEPIKARRVSQTERLWRWSKREPVVAVLGAVVMLTLLTGTVVSTYFALKERHHAARAVAARVGEKSARSAETALTKRLADIDARVDRAITGQKVKFLGLTIVDPSDELVKLFDLPTDNYPPGPIVVSAESPLPLFPTGQDPFRGCQFWQVTHAQFISTANRAHGAAHFPRSVRQLAAAIIACTASPEEYEVLWQENRLAMRKRAESMEDNPAEQQRLMKRSEAKMASEYAGKYVCRVVFHYPRASGKPGTMTTHMRMTKEQYEEVKALIQE